ncbi:unnamed protein product [Hanseniaspora opuntiae]
MQAQFLNGDKYELERNLNHEATSFGAAIAAAFGSKNVSDRVMWKDIDDLKEHVNKHNQFILNSKSIAEHKYICNDDVAYLNEQYHKWDLAIKRSSLWMYEDMKSKL